MPKASFDVFGSRKTHVNVKSKRREERMKNKKIIFFLVLALGAAAFLVTGIRSGALVSSGAQKVYAVSDRKSRKESKKIAVVNLDEGVSENGGLINYAERLSGFPDADFEYAALEAARTGFGTGKYGAYIIIPAVFSQNVESINSVPQISELAYAVDRSYSGGSQYELLARVMSYMNSLNNNLSYMYVDNILREFHEAQDGADSVLENDQKDKEALERVRIPSLVSLVELPEMHEEKNETEMLDIADYAAKDTALALAIDAEYEESIRDIREELFSLSEEGRKLAESLGSLAEQMPEPDLLSDENGGDIAKNAKVKLQEEMERQSAQIVDRERIIRCLTKVKEFCEERQAAEEKQDEEEPEAGGSDAEEEQVRVENLGALFQEAEDLIRELENETEPDIDRICELMETEYIAPVKENAERTKRKLEQNHEAGQELAAAYNEKLTAFCPQMKGDFLAQNIAELDANHTLMQEALSANNQAYMEYAEETSASFKEDTDKMKKHVEEVKQEADAEVTDKLHEAKKVKEETSAVNQNILADFSSKLAYTRLGNAEYEKAYQFIASPVLAADESAAREAGKRTDAAQKKEPESEETLLTVMYAVLGILTAALTVQIYLYSRRRKR